MDKNPFPYFPPKYIRARLYEYKFSDYEAKKEDSVGSTSDKGLWWKRYKIEYK